MSYLAAAIEHHARKLASAVTRAVVEKCSGFSSYEAGDHLQHVHADMLADAEAEYEVAEPARYSIEECFRLLNQSYDECGGCGYMRREHGQLYGALYSGACSAFVEPQTPVAGQRGENPAGVAPPTPAGSPDPSRVTVGAVRGEGSPADSDIPSSPAGERPAWVDWAVPAICDVLTGHTALVPIGDALVHCGGLDGECHSHYGDWELWREHVAGAIAERLEAASKARFCIDDGEPQTVALNAVEFERYLDGWLNSGREHVAQFETGLDMGARIDGASEIFPQHRSTQK